MTKEKVKEGEYDGKDQHKGEKDRASDKGKCQ